MKKRKHIGRYELLSRVGSGGMGVVYDAIDTRDQTRIALKVLLPHAAEASQGLLRFKREFRALARLRHKNIVQVFDAGLEDDVAFIAMEFIEGVNIRDYIKSFSSAKARDSELTICTAEILAALAHVHSRRIVHRDLKPENILVTKDGTVKLVDFGVARIRQNAKEESELLGTFAYMAPEVVTTGQLDGRSDLYALGIILFELLTGRFPFPVEPAAAALHHHVNTPPQLLRHLNPKAPAALAGLAHVLLEKDPLDRPASANDALKWLSAAEIPSSALPDLSHEMPGLLFVPKFVGRDRPLEELEGVASDALAGRGQVVLLEGSAGMGKSRLINELRLRIRRRTHVLLGVAHDPTQPYGAIEAILDGIASIASHADADLARRIAGPDVALLGSISPRLASLGQRVNVSQLEPKERKIRLHKAMIGVFGRLALSRAVVIVVEDIQNADSLTLELIWDAARTLLGRRDGGLDGETVCPVSFVLTATNDAERRSHASVLLRRLQRKKLLNRLQIGPLKRDLIASMLGTMTGVREPFPDLVDRLHEESQGRPDRLQELVHELVRNGELVRQQGIWSYGGQLLDTSSGAFTLESSEVTPALKVRDRNSSVKKTGGLRAKLGLSENAMRLLEELAVLGRVLTGRLITAVSRLQDDDFLDAIDELVRSDLLLEELDGGSVHYRFAFDGLRERVLKALSTKRKIGMHGQIAREIERKFQAERSGLAHVLARHFRKSQSPVRAARYLLKTADQAVLRGDLDGAIQRLDEAARLYEAYQSPGRTADRVAGVNGRKVEMTLAFGRADDALALTELPCPKGSRWPRLILARQHLHKARAFFALGRFDEALAVLGQLPRPLPRLRLAIEALRLEGRIHMERGDYAEARADFEAASKLLATGNAGFRPESLDVDIGVVQIHQGDYDKALARFLRILPALKRAAAPAVIAEALGSIGQIYAAWGQNSEALSFYRQALELSEAKGLRRSTERWNGNMGVMMSLMALEEEAERRLETALNIAREDSNRRGLAEWESQLGVHNYRKGDTDRASKHLARALALAREIGHAVSEARALIFLGAVTLEREFDRNAEARRWLTSGLERAKDHNYRDLCAEACIFMARCWDADGEFERARLKLDEAEDYARKAKSQRLLRLVEDERRALAALDDSTLD